MTQPQLNPRHRRIPEAGACSQASRACERTARKSPPEPEPFAAKKPLLRVASPPRPSPLRSVPSPRPAVTSPASTPARGQVAHKAMPDVSQKALETIRGKVRVSVKVNVDASGKVTNAAFEAPGPSKYFSDAAIHAAKNWTFAPPSSSGEKVPSEWLLRFEFAPAGTDTFSAELNP